MFGTERSRILEVLKRPLEQCPSGPGAGGREGGAVSTQAWESQLDSSTQERGKEAKPRAYSGAKRGLCF